MFCPKCGKEIESRSKFCKFCGAPIEPRADVFSKSNGAGGISLDREAENSSKIIVETKAKKHHPKVWILIVAFAAIFGIWWGFIRETPEEIAYNCVMQRIEEDFYVTSFPKYSSKEIVVTDTHTTKQFDGKDFKVYDVSGNYIANTLIGLTPTIDYKAEVGLYNHGEIYYCEFYDGMIMNFIE